MEERCFISGYPSPYDYDYDYDNDMIDLRYSLEFSYRQYYLCNCSCAMKWVLTNGWWGC